MDLAGQIELVRKDTIDLLELLSEKARAFQLPSIHPQLDDYRTRLQANDYQVLVVGEAKRGKSSFVNALIGRKLVPTDVDSSTCQIFRISRSDHEAYRVRLIDGMAREISRDDLARYGSQVVVDSAGPTDWHEVIDWLEIDAPMRFLPKNIHLIDTPGLGSLYSAHTQITRRFMPFADAVIFVLDSNQPILQQELKFIETILNITSNIFFVQTKIDQHKGEDWKKLLLRNEEILRTHFAQRLSDAHIHPISNVHLLKANLSEGDQIDEDYLRISRYNDLHDKLQVFLFHAAGWKRAAEAVQLAANYHALVRSVLEGRLATARKKSVQRQVAIRQRKDQFDTDWGEDGQLQQDLKNRLGRIFRAARRALHQALQESGTIELNERKQIESLTSLNEAKQYNAVLNDRVIDATIDVWHEVYEDVQRHCGELLAPFLKVTLSFYLDQEIDAVHIPVLHTKELAVKSGWLALAHAAGEETQAILQIAGSLLSLPTVGSLATATQAVTLVTVGCELIRTIVLHSSSRLDDAKKQLTVQLNEVLDSVHRYFFGDEFAIDEKSFIDDFFAAIEEDMMRQIPRIAHAVSSDTQLELDRLGQESGLDEQQRLLRLEQVQEQLDAWDKISVQIAMVEKELNTLDAASGIL